MISLKPGEMFRLEYNGPFLIPNTNQRGKCITFREVALPDEVGRLIPYVVGENDLWLNDIRSAPVLDCKPLELAVL